MDTKKLRQKILDLAIHGKLVPQDPNDEPASVLLERIRSEKERLIKEGKIKRSRKTTKNSDDACDKQEVPFEVPNGWVWCLLEDLAYVAAGSTPNKDAFVAKGIPYIKMYNLRMQKIDFDFHPQYIKREIHEGKLYRSRTEIGDLLMNIVGPPLGKLAVIPSTLPEGNFNQAAVLIRPYQHKELLVKYLFYYLSEMSEINSISTKGSAGQVNISLTQSQNMRIPLPPLVEQQRIVEEVERWFKLIDIIEQGKADLQSTIKQAKNKILDLAIHGKLVPQDPNDEPASELLKRINPKAEITCDNGHYEQIDKCTIESTGDILFSIPNSWTWSRLSEVVKIIMGQSPDGDDVYDTEKENNAYEFHQGKICFTEKYISPSGKWCKNPPRIANIGSLLVCVRAPIGDVNITQRQIGIGRGLAAIAGYVEIKTDFLYYWILAHKKNLIDKGTGSTFKAITSNVIKDLIIPLPPLAEQQRIVAKIEHLFATLKTIEESL